MGVIRFLPAITEKNRVQKRQRMLELLEIGNIYSKIVPGYYLLNYA